ncbi:hypothetical protein, partial [Mycobacterium kiyosense]|uniref:hypothetical protein n=1 Tax=Mycobacterium kiyosense TaxID=2871094 RepID=UPI002230693C
IRASEKEPRVAKELRSNGSCADVLQNFGCTGGIPSQKIPMRPITSEKENVTLGAPNDVRCQLGPLNTPEGVSIRNICR